MARYVVVDQPSKTIVGGPYLWDGAALWAPPESDGRTAEEMVADGDLRIERDALGEGYKYPDPEPMPGEVPPEPAPEEPVNPVE